MDFDAARMLFAREPAAQKLAKAGEIHGARVGLDQGVDRLAKVGMGDADDRARPHGRMTEDRRLDFGGPDIDAARNDQVGPPVGEIEIAFGIERDGAEGDFMGDFGGEGAEGGATFGGIGWAGLEFQFVRAPGAEVGAEELHADIDFGRGTAAEVAEVESVAAEIIGGDGLLSGAGDLECLGAESVKVDVLGL